METLSFAEQRARIRATLLSRAIWKMLPGVLLLCSSALSQAEIQVSPAEVQLRGPEASEQVLVRAAPSGKRPLDLTRQVRYEIADPRIITVSDHGLVRPLAEGRTTLMIHHGDATLPLPVIVTDFDSPPPVSFRHEVAAILTKSGCNSGGCHGKAEGQNGFQLSIFGFDAESDHAALVKESRGRRLSLSSPERSLLLLKGTSLVPHGGGMKLEVGSYRYRRLLRWIAEGARITDDDHDRQIVSLRVEPDQQVLLAGEMQQLRVVAVDDQGNSQCVTHETEFESNLTSIADVNDRGLITAGEIPGEASVLVRYLGHVAICRITIPRPGVEFARPPEVNFIDRLAWDKLEQLGIPPSELADDGTFLRRVFLDVIGTLPTAVETREFLSDSSSDKRARLIARLLARSEYADYWTMRWLDILRADQLTVTPQGTVAMQRWLRRHFAENRPYDQLARELLTVQGNTVSEGPAAFYKALNKPEELSRAVSQLLLGVRIECAQCHHHPSERWSQSDYAGLAGFFTGVTIRKLPAGGEAVVSHGGNDLPHPRTGEPVAARALGASPADFSRVSDRRRVLDRWMTDPDNPFFARAIANRLWAHYFGRGLVEPIDDLRATNPASNEPLLQALEKHLREVNFDLQAFTRTLLSSRLYQLSSQTNEGNADDRQNFSHAAYKALPAEVLLDAICQTTGVAEKFNGWPDGYRAIQVWDNRMPSYFFTIFGRPVRATVCECERSNEPSISQALHLLNSPEIMAKIQHRHGTARRLAHSDSSPDEIVDDIYLEALSRFPTAEERALMLEAFTEPGITRRAAVEDILWAVLNSKDFLFNH